MAKHFVYLDGRDEVIPELSPMPFNGTNASNDLRADLLRHFVSSCADACDFLKPKLKQVKILTEQFSELSITVEDAVREVRANPKAFPGLSEAKSNLPEIFRW